MIKKYYQVYCDLDGVLINFEKGIVDSGNTLINNVKNTIDINKPININDFENKYQYDTYKLIKKVYNQFNGWKDEYTFSDFESREKGSRAFRDLMYHIVAKDKNWWINLEWMPNGKNLWSNIQKYDPIILSSPIGPISKEGKIIWCKNNLGLTNDKIIIVDDKGIKTEKTPILIDDRMKSIRQIENVGGLGILYTDKNYKNALEILNNIINII